MPLSLGGLRAWQGQSLSPSFTYIGENTIWETTNLSLIPTDTRRDGDLALETGSGIIYRWNNTLDIWEYWQNLAGATVADLPITEVAEGATGVVGVGRTYRATIQSGKVYWVPDLVYTASPTRAAWFVGTESNAALATQGSVLLSTGGASIATNGTSIVCSCTTTSDIARIFRNEAGFDTSTSLYLQTFARVTSFTGVDGVNTFIILGQFSDSATFIRLGRRTGLLSGDISFDVFDPTQPNGYVIEEGYAASTEVLLEILIRPNNQTDLWQVYIDSVYVGSANQDKGTASASRSFAVGCSTSSTSGDQAVLELRDYALFTFSP
jgi:hypothetical protein